MPNQFPRELWLSRDVFDSMRLSPNKSPGDPGSHHRRMSWQSRETSSLSQDTQSRTYAEDETPQDPTSTVTYTETTTANTWRSIIRGWWCEISWVIFSALCLGAMILLLLFMNNKPLSTWTFSISLNAIISFLIVTMKAAMIYSTACCVGQLKWHHFQQCAPRSVYDLKTFDEASKGPLGALKLALRVRSVSKAALFGSGILLCAVVMETFGQQIVFYHAREMAVNGSLATFPVSNRLAPQESWYLDYTMMSDIQKLLLTAIFRGEKAPEFECSTGTCSWPASLTLGICSSCRDITADSNGSCITDSRLLQCQYTTPDGIRLGGSVEPDGPMPLINTSTVDGIYDMSPSFYNFSTLVVAESTNWTTKLTACELSWCAWTYDNATSSGTAISLHGQKRLPLESVGTWEKTNETDSFEDTQKVYALFGKGNPGRLNETFTISSGKEYFLKYAVKLILKAGYQGSDFYTQLTLATSSLDYTNTGAMSDNLAAFITDALRTQDEGQSLGTAWQSVTFIEVRWIWLLLPGLEVLAASILLYVTISQSARQETVLWKSSLLPFLFCSAQGWTNMGEADRDAELVSLKSIEQVSKTMTARLEQDDEGRFKLVQA